MANIDGYKICDSCGYKNKPNVKKCKNCGKEKFAPPWVIEKRPINRQVSVEITSSDARFRDVERRITLTKWWKDDNTKKIKNSKYNIPSLNQWRKIKRIIDNDLGPLLDWDTKKGTQSDFSELYELLPTLAKYNIKDQKDLRRLLAARKVLHYMTLEEVLKDFEKKLKVESEEKDWQLFFKDNLLFLNPGYIKILEKTNIALDIQLPDFLLINIENYIDVYEIKTPETKLLGYDGSHKNYYWSSDITKAIVQVENYIDSIEKNSDGLRSKLKDKHKIELRVVRPRGYVIAGHSRQLTESTKKNDDFKLLNQSLKNTEILPYDIFLERFKSFSNTLKDSR